MNIESRNLHDEASQFIWSRSWSSTKWSGCARRAVLCGIFAVSVGVFAATPLL